MAKWASNTVLEAPLGEVGKSVRMVALPSQPADLTQVNADRLAEVALAAGDYTISNGITSGRRTTVAAKAGVPVVGTGGTATHVALVTTSALVYVTTCPNAVLSQGGTVNFSAWDVEIGQPT